MSNPRVLLPHLPKFTPLFAKSRPQAAQPSRGGSGDRLVDRLRSGRLCSGRLPRALISPSFRPCAWLHPQRGLITGLVCGVRVEAVEDPLMQLIRQLDKLVDELAKGRPMSKILRA